MAHPDRVPNIALNGRRVASATQSGAPTGNSGQQVVLGKVTASTSGASFTGLLDDVWAEAGTGAIADLEELWFVCQKTHPAALIFQSFESCPAGGGSAAIVRRGDGALASCPAPSGALCP